MRISSMTELCSGQSYETLPPIDNGTQNSPKITEHSAERSAERGTFGESLKEMERTYWVIIIITNWNKKTPLLPIS